MLERTRVGVVSRKGSAISTPKESKRRFICNDCTRVFTVYGALRKVFCPQCGECINVVRYKPVNKTDRKQWTKEELEQAQVLRSRGVSWGAMAIKLKRSKGSIRRKLGREKDNDSATS